MQAMVGAQGFSEGEVEHEEYILYGGRLQFQAAYRVATVQSGEFLIAYITSWRVYVIHLYLLSGF